MGKNDLWIAATASAFDLQLVTMDKDFNHLAPSYIDLLYVETT
jgi:predicted nucleic acid-binding protein